MHFLMYVPRIWQQSVRIKWGLLRLQTKQLRRSYCSAEVTRTVNYCILTLLLAAWRDLKYTGDILQPVVEYVRDQYTTFIFTFAFKMVSSSFWFYLCPTSIEASLPDACYAYLNLHIYMQLPFCYCYAKTANLGVEFAMQFLYFYF
jgi:hypothetical protein